LREHFVARVDREQSLARLAFVPHDSTLATWVWHFWVWRRVHPRFSQVFGQVSDPAIVHSIATRKVSVSTDPGVIHEHRVATRRGLEKLDDLA
jgi:hypothetical protein